MRVERLSTNDVLAIRSRLADTLVAEMDAFGSATPIWPDKLEMAVQRQHTGFGRTQKYNTPAEVAATLLYGVGMNHAFENGNKRTALVTMLVSLNRNKVVLVETGEDELFDLVRAMAAHELPIGDGARDVDAEVAYIAQWIDNRGREVVLGDQAVKFKELRAILEGLGCTFDKPSKNFIKVHRAGYSYRMGYPRANHTVGVRTIKELRRVLKLDELHGVDSAAFYALEDEVDEFVNTYRNLMRRLADL